MTDFLVAKPIYLTSVDKNVPKFSGGLNFIKDKSYAKVDILFRRKSFPF